MPSIIDRYPMNSARQAHASMWLATRDLQAGKITEDEFGELRGYLQHRMEKFEQGSAQRQAIKQWLMSSTARLTNHASGR